MENKNITEELNNKKGQESKKVKTVESNFLANLRNLMGLAEGEELFSEQHQYELSIYVDKINIISEADAENRETNPGTTISTKNEDGESVTLKIGRILSEDEMGEISGCIITIPNTSKIILKDKSVIYYVEDIDVDTVEVEDDDSVIEKNLKISEKIASKFIVTNVSEEVFEAKDGKKTTLPCIEYVSSKNGKVGRKGKYLSTNTYRIFITGKNQYKSVLDNYFGMELEIVNNLHEKLIEKVIKKFDNKKKSKINVIAFQDLLNDETYSNTNLKAAKGFEDEYKRITGKNLSDNPDLHKIYLENLKK